MVLGKIKDMITGGSGGKDTGPGRSRNVNKVSSFDEDTEPNKSPMTTRRKRGDLDMPSKEDIPDASGSSGRGAKRKNTRSERTNRSKRRNTGNKRTQRKDPVNNRQSSEREMQRPNKTPSTKNERGAEPDRRTTRRSDEKKEMLQEILRKLEDIDRKLDRRR